jgi:hypothetical protein
MTHALFVALASHPPCNRPGISSKSALNAPSLRLSAPTIGTHTSLQDLRRTVGASEIPIAPADRGAHLTRFPSLAAFERRPTGHGTCCQLGEWGRHPKPVTATDIRATGKNDPKETSSEVALRRSNALRSVAKYTLASYFALAHSMTGTKGPSADGIGAAAR